MRKLAWLALPLLLGTAAAAPALPPFQGILTARVQGPPRQSLPRELTVRVRPSLGLKGQETLSWETAVTCPVRSGRWRCAVPAAERVDLRIEGAAVMPVYRWSEKVAEGQVLRLGTLRLQRGATISGWVQVDSEEGQAKVPEYAVQVQLVPQEKPRIRLRSNPLPLMTLELGSKPWGFFRFDSLGPGRYTVVATQPGRAPVRLPVQIQGEKSVEIPEPLRLRRPANLAGRIDPPLPPVAKGLRQPWRVRLSPQSSPFPGEYQMVMIASGDGSWNFRDLAAGDYFLSILDESGAAWMVQEIRLQPGPQTRSFKIPTRTLFGRVVQAGKPLRANLSFQGEDSQGPFRVDADEDGRFQRVVPESVAQKAWRVRLQAPGILPLFIKDPFRPLHPVEEAVRIANGPEIQVPDTCLPVVVVDSRQRPVPSALVIVPGSPENWFRTDASGFCEIRGLKPGIQQVLAKHPELPSRGEAVQVELREGIKAPLLRVTLPDRIEVYGRVEPAFGTASGALVVARPSGSEPVVYTLTDPDGEFSLLLPAGTRAVELAVLAPGSAFRKLRVEVDPKRVLQVPVEPAGGTLVLEVPEDLLKTARESQTLESDLDLLCRWADLQGCTPEPGRLVVPNVEPGPYTLSAGELPRLEHGGPADPGDPRPHGVLEAEGELALRLPGGP